MSTDDTDNDGCPHWSVAYFDVSGAASSSSSPSSTDWLFCRMAPPSVSPTTSCAPSDPKSADWPSTWLFQPMRRRQHADRNMQT